MIDESLEIFKGQISYDALFKDMPYKDMIGLRDSRVKRLIKEREEQEAKMKQDEAEQKRAMARQQIMHP